MDTSVQPDSRKWGRLVYDFTQETTMHGVRYITAATHYVLRRLVSLYINNITKFYTQNNTLKGIRCVYCGIFITASLALRKCCY